MRSFALDPAQGLVVDLIAALGSCGAAIVAVVIATGDRRQRTAERLDAAKAQAMLVLLNVEVSQGSPAFNVWVGNFGAQAILDVQVDSARFARVPTAKFEVINRLGPTLKVLDADRNRDSGTPTISLTWASDTRSLSQSAGADERARSP